MAGCCDHDDHDYCCSCIDSDYDRVEIIATDILSGQYGGSAPVENVPAALDDQTAAAFAKAIADVLKYERIV